MKKNKSKINIEKYSKEDMVELITVMQLADNRTPIWAEERLKTFNTRKRVLLVAKTKNKIIGYAAVKALEQTTAAKKFLDTNTHACLMWIAVLPEYRNKGIGSSLLNHIEKCVSEMKKIGIWLDCRESKIPFYEKNNYKLRGNYPEGSQKRFVLSKNLGEIKMKGNEKISFTAQAICLMRAVLNEDKYSKHFLTDKIKKQYYWVEKLTPKNKLKAIFERRIQLSRELDSFIKIYKPEQILELASGYSPRALLLTQKNKKLVYMETDFSSVIQSKNNILENIELKENISLSKNHILLPFDVVNGNFNILLKYFDKNKKTLVLAETLANYLSEEEHEKMLEKIKVFLNNFKHSAYLSHESKFAMTSSFLGRILMFYRNVVAKTKNIVHFHNPKEIRMYFSKKGFRKVKILDSKKTHNIIYLVELK